MLTHLVCCIFTFDQYSEVLYYGTQKDLFVYSTNLHYVFRCRIYVYKDNLPYLEGFYISSQHGYYTLTRLVHFFDKIKQFIDLFIFIFYYSGKKYNFYKKKFESSQCVDEYGPKKNIFST